MKWRKVYIEEQSMWTQETVMQPMGLVEHRNVGRI